MLGIIIINIFSTVFQCDPEMYLKVFLMFLEPWNINNYDNKKCTIPEDGGGGGGGEKFALVQKYIWVALL